MGMPCCPQLIFSNLFSRGGKSDVQLVASSLAVCSSCWGFWSVSGVVLVGAEIREDVRGARGRKCCGEEAADGAASAACAVRVEREDERRTGRLHGGHRRQR